MTHARLFHCIVMAWAVLIILAMPVAASTDGLYRIGTTEQIDTDQRTGLALGGFDPVSYFVDRQPRPGRPDLDAVWRGAAWRFANAANRDAFLADPARYAPAFGGYDAAVIGTGIAASGNPGEYAIIDGRLFLFRSAPARERFVATGGLAAAEAAWPAVLQKLVP